MLDEVAERAVISQLHDLATGRAIVVATHRLALLEIVDRVIVLDGGAVAHDGQRHKVLETLSSKSDTLTEAGPDNWAGARGRSMVPRQGGRPGQRCRPKRARSGE